MFKKYQNKFIMFYTDGGRFMGKLKAKNLSRAEYKTWLESGHYFKFNNFRYELNKQHELTSKKM